MNSVYLCHGRVFFLLSLRMPFVNAQLTGKYVYKCGHTLKYILNELIIAPLDYSLHSIVLQH